jgi:hypothetical protein
MANVEDKSLDVVELPEDLTQLGKSPESNVEAVVDEVDIARIEKVYK